MTRLGAALGTLWHFGMLCLIGLFPIFFGTTAFSGGLLLALGCGFLTAMGFAWIPEHKEGLINNLNILFSSKVQDDSEDNQNDSTSSNEEQP